MIGAVSSLPTVSLAAAGRILATLALAVPCAAARPAGVAPVDDDVAGGGAVERHCAAELQSAFDALDAGDAARALDHYRAAVGMATTDALRFQALLGLGSTYAALQRYDEAVAALKRARSLAPESADAWYTLGSVYAAAGRTDDALRALGEAAAFLADDREIPAGVVERMGRPMIPRWFYNLAADWGWKRQAKKFATSARLKERPYSEER